MLTLISVALGIVVNKKCCKRNNKKPVNIEKEKKEDEIEASD